MAGSDNRLRELRTQRNLTLEALGNEIGVYPSTILRWETGHTAIPDPRKQELAEFFGVTVAYLMYWDEPNGNGGLRDVA